MKAKSPLFSLILISLIACSNPPQEAQEPKEVESPSISERIPVIFDTDANNELDDQHALAYLLFNADIFDIRGVTVNATFNGGDISGHYEEAERILQLCNSLDRVPLLKGANGDFEEIDPTDENFDGNEAVDFIIDESNKNPELVVIAVGKLTNVALALAKNPSVASKMRVVWLGSNYPEPGEYNQVNDTSSLTYVLNTEVPFEMVTVRYGRASGTDAVRVTEAEVQQKMPGMGPNAENSIVGRHGGTFSNFGDYAVDLFKYIDYHDDSRSRALFDMAAVAVVKNPSWAEAKIHPSPKLIEEKWLEQPENSRSITIWENFDKELILEDFFARMNDYQLP